MTTPDPSTRPVALIAGGSRGLGLELCREFAERGHDVHVCARDAAELERVAAEFAIRGQTLQTAVVDVTDADAVTAWVERVGRVDVALCVAGVITVGPWWASGRQIFDDCLDLMVGGVINVALAVAPGMVERGSGHIGVISSVGGLVSVPHLLPYSTAKFAAAGFGQGLAAELAGTGVSVTTVFPGLMRTGSHVAAEFVGDREAEYAWFAPGAAIPVVSIDARRAAHRIARGVLAGRPIVAFTPITQVAMRVKGLAPGLVVTALGVMNRLLPGSPREGSRPRATTPERGATVRRRLDSRLVDALTTLGDRASRRNNEPRA